MEKTEYNPENDRASWGTHRYSERAAHIGFLLSQAGSVFSIGHPSPDGDSLGAQLALHNFCRLHGKKSAPLNFDDLSAQISWLKGCDDLRSSFEKDEIFDLGFLMETTDISRMGDRVEYFKHARTLVHLDHHVDVTGLGNVNLLDESASSTCEILFNVLTSTGTQLTREVLEPLYVGVMTDTGNFRYQGTTPRSHEIAAQVIQAGIPIDKIFARVYENTSLANVIMHGIAMSRAKTLAGGKIAYSWLCKRDFEDASARESDAGGAIRSLCKINGAAVVMMFRETENNKVKISFRSNNGFDVRGLSVAFGGGGHSMASGAQIDGPIQEAMARVLDAAQASFDAFEKSHA